MSIKSIRSYTENCTGDVCVGDEILFDQDVFYGSFRNPKYAGTRRVAAIVTKDSYGADKQQHTFTLKILGSDGFESLKNGITKRIKGRNLYRNGTLRKPRNFEERQEFLDEKHDRGSVARIAANLRKEGTWFCG